LGPLPQGSYVITARIAAVTVDVINAAFLPGTVTCFLGTQINPLEDAALISVPYGATVAFPLLEVIDSVHPGSDTYVVQCQNATDAPATFHDVLIVAISVGAIN